MAVTPGTRIGVYEVTSQLGEGGMGVVFRARDTRLLRDAALKVLPDHFADDPDRMARLQREAQVLASLNHPNIAQIYGLEQVGSAGCIVMELVEGETIADRLKSGPLPLDEAITIAKQIADALAAAHEQGIVHRDLKPTNIKLTPGGVVKVLDFGLAKALGPRGGETGLSMMATQMTGSVVGAVVGTAAYMSPEQARGKAVDARTDIWAFGCVLFEMLTGTQAFAAETVTDTIARIVTGAPDFSLLPPATPAAIRLLLQACLEKSAAHRLQHIGDVRLFLDPRFQPADAATAPAAKGWRSRDRAIAAALGIALIAALVPAVLYFRPAATASAPQMRFELAMAGGTGVVAVSPDGERIAYVINSAEGARSVWVRPIGSENAQRLAGTDNLVGGPTWSPDGRSLAFISEGQLRRVDVATGTVRVICEFTGAFRGLGWSSDGTMLVAQGNGISRASENGGGSTPLTEPDAALKETIHAVPTFLPDGKRFLFVVVSSVEENRGIFVQSLDAPKMKTRVMPLPTGINWMTFVPPGYLLYSSGATIQAQRIDVERATMQGDPVQLAEDVENGVFSSSNTGLLFYRKGTGTPANKQLTWYDRGGRVLGLAGAAANYGTIELSPTGDRAAVDIITSNNRDIWVVDLARGVPSRITFDAASEWSPSWSPDGTRLVFASSRSDRNHIYAKAASGVGAEELVFKSDDNEIPVSWSHDGRYIVFSRLKTRGLDTWVLDMAPPERKASLFIESPFDKIHARVSPDGRWVAYATNDSGMYQVVVQSFPDPNGGKWQITAQGGVEPKWRHDGRELYYLALDGKLMAVPVKGEKGIFEAGTPSLLFDTGLTINRQTASRDRRYDVAPDGRFLLATPIASAVNPVVVVVNWMTGLGQKASS